jgi:hypothetical protein
MGEVAALTAAFDTEFNKNLQALPAISACPPSEHDAHLNHYRIVQRIAELVAYYASRLPPYISLQASQQGFVHEHSATASSSRCNDRAISNGDHVGSPVAVTEAFQSSMFALAVMCMP